jgi:hypothetical protein
MRYMKKPKRISSELINKINPLLNPGEKIICVFKEPFHWDEMQKRWLVLTDLRLVVLYKTLLGVVSIDDIHLRDLDIEFVQTKFGIFDLVYFRNRDRVLYQMGAARTRRAELSEFIKTTTTAITKREVAFRSALNQSQPTNCDNISTLKELNKLKESGAITEAEYLAKKEELLRKIG